MAAPANDDFADAEVLTGSSGTVTGTNVDATFEVGEPAADDGGEGDDADVSVWYRWVATGDGSTTFDTFGSDFDTVLHVYTGASIGALSLVAANDDFDYTINRQSKVTFSATVGTTYHVRVNGYSTTGGSTDYGDIVLNWDGVGPPVVTVTTTIYSTTGYGYYQASDADYETARAGAAAFLATADYLIAGQQTGFATFYCFEAFIAFDTSAIVEPYVASLQLTAADVVHDSIDFTLEARLYDWGPTLTDADWVAGDDLAALPLLATWESTDFVANPDYNIFTDFADGLNLTGTTKIIIVGKNLTDGNPPAMVPGELVNEYATFNIVFPSGTTLDAKLVISQPAVGGWGVGMVRMGAN